MTNEQLSKLLKIAADGNLIVFDNRAKVGKLTARLIMLLNNIQKDNRPGLPLTHLCAVLNNDDAWDMAYALNWTLIPTDPRVVLDEAEKIKLKPVQSHTYYSKKDISDLGQRHDDRYLVLALSLTDGVTIDDIINNADAMMDRTLLGSY